MSLNLDRIIERLEKIEATQLNLSKNIRGEVVMQVWVDKNDVLEILKNPKNMVQPNANIIRYNKRVSVYMRRNSGFYQYAISARVMSTSENSFEDFSTTVVFKNYATAEACRENFAKYSAESLEEILSNKIEKEIRQRMKVSSDEAQANSLAEWISGVSSGSFRL